MLRPGHENLVAMGAIDTIADTDIIGEREEAGGNTTADGNNSTDGDVSTGIEPQKRNCFFRHEYPLVSAALMGIVLPP